MFRSQAFKDGSTQRQLADMVQETTQRVSALPVTPHAIAVFNMAKEKGLSKLLSAGNAVVSQVTGKNTSNIAKSKAGAWLSIGAAAAGTILNAAQNRGMGFWVLLNSILTQHLMLIALLTSLTCTAYLPVGFLKSLLL